MPDHDAHDHLSHALDLDEADAIAQSAHVLSAPSRVRLLWALLDGERSAGELAELADLSAAAASQQLRVLRLARFVATRRDGRSIRYRLHDHHIAGLLHELRDHAQHARLGWASPERPAAESERQA